jgi:RecA/RadA recombinase
MARQRREETPDADIATQGPAFDEETPPPITEEQADFGDDVADIVTAPRAVGLSAFGEVAKQFKAWRPAREVLTRVRAVPTIFPQVDHATRVGGWPIQRIHVIHGQSNHGKTVFSHGLGLSFLKRNHIYALVDAEMTTPITWLESLMGPYADANTFLAMRPKTYEQCVDDVRRLCNGIAEARVKGKIPPDTTALIVVDSIRKLVPDSILERIKKMGADSEKGSVDGYGGRAAQMRAALNAAWMDELVPLMHDTNCAITLIARESEDPNADANDRMYGNDWKMGGGKSLEFESSLIARIQRAGYVHETSDTKSPVIGERIRVDIRKTKVAAKQDKVIRCHFHISNGAQTPEGFDPARDLIELGLTVGVIKRASEGSTWLLFERNRWQGLNQAAKKVSSSPELLATLDAAVREKFVSVNPLEVADVEDA